MKSLEKIKTWQISCIFLVFILAIYHHILNAPFLWDDEVMILGNTIIKGRFDLVSFFNTGAFGAPIKEASFYRPIQIMSYYINYHFFNNSLLSHHLFNISLHFGAVLFLFLFLKELKLTIHIAFTIALLFCVHPLNIENVTYLSGRGDVLCHFFSFLSLYLFLKAGKRNSIAVYLFSLLAYALALFSKENTVFLPLLLPFTGLIQIKKEKFTTTKKIFIVVFLIGMLTYTGFRIMLIGQNVSKALSLIASADLAVRIYTFPAIIINYIRLLLMPVNLHTEYHFIVDSPWSLYMLGFLVILGSWIFVLIKAKNIRKQLLFWTLWFVVFLLPVQNIVFPLAASLREHWVSFSMAGFFMLIILLIDEFSIKKQKSSFKKLIWIATSIFIVFLSIKTYYRNTFWNNALDLYSHDVKLSPKSFILWNNLGVEHFRTGKLEAAGTCFQKSINVCPPPGYAPSHNNMGVYFNNKQQPDKALKHYKKAILLDDYQLAYQNLGPVCLQLNKTNEGLETLNRGGQLYPDDPEIAYWCGILLVESGNISKAENKFKQLERRHPAYKETRNILKEIQNIRNSMNE